jgi:hypothetical protein
MPQVVFEEHNYFFTLGFNKDFLAIMCTWNEYLLCHNRPWCNLSLGKRHGSAWSCLNVDDVINRIGSLVSKGIVWLKRAGKGTVKVLLV